MHNFSKIAVKLLKAYKSLLKKQLRPEDSDKRLSSLGLDKRLPTHEIALYELVNQIIHKVHTETKTVQSYLKFSGIEQFIQHMKHELSFYKLEGNMIIHTTQATSDAMIQAIQIMGLPVEKHSPPMFSKLQVAASLVARYGVEEQKTVFLNSLKSHLHRNVDFLQPLLNEYEGYLAENSPDELKEGTTTEEVVC